MQEAMIETIVINACSFFNTWPMILLFHHETINNDKPNLHVGDVVKTKESKAKPINLLHIGICHYFQAFHVKGVS